MVEALVYKIQDSILHCHVDVVDWNLFFNNSFWSTVELYGTEEKKYHALDAQDHLIDAFVYIMKLTTKIQLVLWFQDKRLHFKNIQPFQ